MLRAAALAGVVGPAVFAALVLVGGALYDGYSHTGQKISELGGEGSEVALLQNTNFVLLGVFTLAFAWALARSLGRPYLGPALVGVFGVSAAIANGLLPCDIGCYGLTPVSQAHNITGLLAILAAIAGMGVLARRWRDDPDWRGHARPTMVAVAVAGSGLVWFIATQVMDRQSLAGVAQRTFVGALLGWMAVTGWRLFRQLDREDPRSEVPSDLRVGGSA
ncbi:MAG TPA: DUF998 domain-containing protein [Acidimicrobiia bacterium]|nr:DUF998 domain-containing protein [Acidimicrobiia bacterium]